MQPRRHHYIPQHLLKNFAFGGPGKAPQVFAFDKSTQKSFRTSVENVAVQRDFNSLSSGQVSWEEPLSQVEAVAAPRLSRIIDCESIAVISDDETKLLCLFVAVQFVRGVDYRERYKDLVRSISDWTEEQQPNVPLPEQLVAAGQEEAVREFALAGLSQAPGIGRILETKTLLLLQANPRSRFILGDAPTTLQNARDFGPYGNLGLAVPGIEIYFPISPRHQLAFWCPSLIEQMQSGASQLEAAVNARAGLAVLTDPLALKRATEFIEKSSDKLDEAKRTIDAIQNRKPVPFKIANRYRALPIKLHVSTHFKFALPRDGYSATLMSSR